MVRVVSLSVLLTLIIILGLTFFQVLAPFLLPLFLAGVFAILCQPLFRYYLHRTRNHVRLASALTTGTVVSIILIPIGLVIVLSSLQLYVVARKLGDRGWTATYREMTEPLLQSVADFLNDSVRQPGRGAGPGAGDAVSGSGPPFGEPDDAPLAAGEAGGAAGGTAPPGSRAPPAR